MDAVDGALDGWTDAVDGVLGVGLEKRLRMTEPDR